MLGRTFTLPMSRSYAVLWAIGFAMFEVFAILLFRRVGTGISLPFVGAAIVLFVLALWTLWRNAWAFGFGMLVAAAQIPAVFDCARELQTGAFAFGATYLAAGIDPRAAAWVHLVYSLVGSAFFAWALIRLVLVVRNRPPKGAA
jgi:hypothetical protein